MTIQNRRFIQVAAVAKLFAVRCGLAVNIGRTVQHTGLNEDCCLALCLAGSYDKHLRSI